ncbi:MAG TPA: hypothetical protein VFL82_14185 [Thermomicrobiales bacterium]|nr:hypothetical protein [Thermomicrobiales bacterium]
MVTTHQTPINDHRKPNGSVHIPTVGNGVVAGTGVGFIAGMLLGAATTNPDLTILTGASIGAALGLITGAAVEIWRNRSARR